MGHRKESQGLNWHRAPLLEVSELTLEMGLIYILQRVGGRGVRQRGGLGS